MDKNLQKDFIVHKGLAVSCSVDVGNCDKEKVGCAAALQDFAIQLCKFLKLDRLNDCAIMTHVNGDDSFRSFIQLVRGGVISGHGVPESGHIFVDVFVMGLFDPGEISQFTQEFFGGGRKTKAIKIRN